MISFFFFLFFAFWVGLENLFTLREGVRGGRGGGKDWDGSEKQG
jgi:hypothetical protein